MQLSASTSEVLNALDTLSQGKLTRRNDLGILIELAAQGKATSILDELSFFAKFVSRTAGLMKRIGREEKGYESLQREFSSNLQKVMGQITILLEAAPSALQQSFRARYLAMTPSSVEELLALCYDLGWYKNWLIDR